MHFPIIVHSHLRWDFVWQRPQQIFSRLARRHPVLFLEEPIVEPGSPPSLRLSEPQAGLLRMIPVLPEPLGVDDACAVVLPLLRAALAHHVALRGRFDAPVQWFYSPMTAPHFVGQLGELGIVYDCMDELRNFRHAPPDISERESFLLARADVVFTGGRQLFAARSRQHRNVHFFGCGVDSAHFGRARDESLAIPSELANVPRPILGYFGVIDERLDYGLLAHLAREFSGGTLAMVGPLAKVQPSELPWERNILWLGQQAYADLPRFVRAFDVCLMPFAMNEATCYINPTKTLEYMAAGKPIVSTPVPDVVEQFSDVVDIAASPEQFSRAVRRALEAPRPQVLQQGIDLAAECTWDAIVARMGELIVAAVAPRAKVAA
ncbi:MAG TPA: glycosyltransferase [Burkholderiales bacterium]|nr:glycosyltransferase [Burkholderiales bacterium]